MQILAARGQDPLLKMKIIRLLNNLTDIKNKKEGIFYEIGNCWCGNDCSGIFA